jgi:hypothetical protein
MTAARIAAALEDLGCTTTAATNIAYQTTHNLIRERFVQPDDDLTDLSPETRGIAGEVTFTLAGMLRLAGQPCPDLGQPMAHAAWAVRQAIRHAHIPA